MNISELQNNPPTDKNDYYTYIDYIDTQFHNVLTSASSDLVKNLQVTVPVKKPESISNPNDVKTYIDDVTKAINQQLVTVLRENNRFAKDFADLTQKIKKTRDSLKNNYDMIKTITGSILPTIKEIGAYTITQDIIESLTLIASPNVQSSQNQCFSFLYTGQNPRERQAQIKALYQRIFDATQNNTPLTFISTVCPSYSHTDGKYDFQSLTNKVGLLTTHHIHFYQQIQETIQKHGLTMQVQIVIADVAEGYDQLILKRYANGDLDTYLHINKQTVVNTQEHLDSLGLGDNITAISMLNLYQKQALDYIAERQQFEQGLREKLQNDTNFGNRFATYMEQRSTMIENFLTALGAAHSDENKITRGIFALAQYLDHFARLRKSHPHAIIVNHKTSSLPYINQEEGGNVFPLIVLDTHAY